MTRLQSPFSNPKFLATCLLGSVIVGVAAVVTPPAAQIAILGVLVTALAGLLVAWLDEQAQRDANRRAEHHGSVVDIEDEATWPASSPYWQRVSSATEQTESVLRWAATKLLSVASELEQMRGDDFLAKPSPANQHRDLYNLTSYGLPSVVWSSVRTIGKIPGRWRDN
jgi:hypothetical protein